MEEPTFHPLDYLSVVRRRKWWLIIPIAASVVIGALLAVLWPQNYISEAQIGVAAPTLSPELLRGVSSLDKEERQRAISQQLLSPRVLERVVREEKLEPERPVEDVAGSLRSKVEKNISVPNPIGKNTDPQHGIDSFIMGYTDNNPERAQKITNRLAYVFVEENSKTQTDKAQNTSEVLGQQLNASQERLAQLEAQLRTKKEANMGRLPDQISANVATVTGLRSQLESLSVQLRSEQDRLSVIESQIEMMRQGAPGATSTGATAINGAQARIALLQQQLTQERALGKTDKHPDVVALQDEINNARAELNSAKPTGGSREELLQADPMYRQRVQERDLSRARIRTLQAAESNARAQISQYQSRVDAAPMVEQALVPVTRDVELERERYKDLKTRYESARLNEDLARKQGGERFTVLYPASPGRPENPLQRLKLFFMPVALGFMLGSALVVGREFMDRSVHDARALQNEFEIPVLGEIPRIHGAA
jgi:polysaccharide chain length determinant protein (PEP-CTERM system associated)